MCDTEYELGPAKERLISRGTTVTCPSELLENYVSEIMELQLEYAEFQQQIEQITINWIGGCSEPGLSESSDKLKCLIKRTTSAQKAIHDKEVLRRYDDRNGSSSIEDTVEQLENLKEEGRIYTELERLNRLQASSVRLLNTKLTTRNTRRSLALSAVAILVSSGILIASIWQIW